MKCFNRYGKMGRSIETRRQEKGARCCAVDLIFENLVEHKKRTRRLIFPMLDLKKNVEACLTANILSRRHDRWNAKKRNKTSCREKNGASFAVRTFRSRKSFLSIADFATNFWPNSTITNFYRRHILKKIDAPSERL